MGKVGDYAFINAKLRARLGSMRESHLFDEMIKAPSLSEAVSLLKDTRYSHLVEVYEETGDLEQVELAILEEEIATYREIGSFLKGEGKSMVFTLLEKVESDNLRNAFRLWYSSQIRKHSMSYRSAYIYKGKIVNDIDYEKLINSRTYEDVLSSINRTPYYQVFRKYDIESLTSGGLFYIEIDLDHLYFSHLFEATENLSSEDREVAYKLYEVDVDLKNILLYIRYAFYHHLPPSSLKNVLIPYGYIYKRMEKSDIFSNFPNAEEKVHEIVSLRYGEILTDIDGIRKADDDLTGEEENAEHILSIENYLAKTRKKEYSKILRGDPFTIGVTLSYLYSYKDEERILRAILSAKFYKWDDERIREALT